MTERTSLTDHHDDRVLAAFDAGQRHQDAVDDSRARCLAERDYVQDRRLR